MKQREQIINNYINAYNNFDIDGMLDQIVQFKHDDHQTEIDVEYSATLAADLSNELKKGMELELKGKSIFRFSHGKIIVITDIS